MHRQINRENQTKMTTKNTFTPVESLEAGAWLDSVTWNEQGLVPVIAQEVGSKDILMMAWMNRDALLATMRLGEAVYWTRSRQKLWHKGEESGHTQKVKEIRLDCDGDTILLMVEQKDGIACHTGEHSCFFQGWDSVKSAWVDESKGRK
jgi:phosphoribosyl-AMP cyclohydrolase